MGKKIIQTKESPEPIGPYSQAVMVDNTVFISGQIALNPSTGILDSGDIISETHQVMHNLRAILSEVKMDFGDVVKTTIFLSDMSLFTSVNEVYGKYFKENFPARETVAVKGLPRNAHVEISMIACKPVSSSSPAGRAES